MTTSCLNTYFSILASAAVFARLAQTIQTMSDQNLTWGSPRACSGLSFSTRNLCRNLYFGLLLNEPAMVLPATLYSFSLTPYVAGCCALAPLPRYIWVLSELMTYLPCAECFKVLVLIKSDMVIGIFWPWDVESVVCFSKIKDGPMATPNRFCPSRASFLPVIITFGALD